jgi:PilZ domain-containing protein
MAHSEIAIGGPGASFRELRRWPRLKIRVPVTVIVKKPNKTVYVDGRGTDLNEGGIAVFAGAELGIGEEVEISFTPPYHGEPLLARTIIRNRRG